MGSGFRIQGSQWKKNFALLCLEPLNFRTPVWPMPRFTPEQLLFAALAAAVILGLSLYRMFFLY
jgi:hypothetical protein